MTLPLRGSGVGALRQTRGPQQPNPQSRRGRTGIRKVNGEKSNRLWTRRRQQNRCGNNQTQGRGIKQRGKLGKTEPNPSGGKHKPYQKTMLQRYTKEGKRTRDGNEPGKRVWGTRVEKTGRKEGEESLRETHREQEQGDLWRTGTDRGTKR